MEYSRAQQLRTINSNWIFLLFKTAQQKKNVEVDTSQLLLSSKNLINSKI